MRPTAAQPDSAGAAEHAEPRTARISPAVAHLLKMSGAPHTARLPAASNCAPAPYPAHVLRELAPPEVLATGAQGLPVRRLQEWLSLHGFQTTVDGEFGAATARALGEFQLALGLPATQRLEVNTWARLVSPLATALTHRPGGSREFDSACLETAGLHVRQHPREAGGDNRGPWVRTYMQGHEGAEWHWCAGFVSFVLTQTALRLGASIPGSAPESAPGSNPTIGSFSCDTLAAQGQSAGRLVAAEDLDARRIAPRSLGEAFIFLVRRSAGDWQHAGIGFNLMNGTFNTIEGNTNDDGSRNGYEVCSRIRSIANKDFIVIA